MSGGSFFDRFLAGMPATRLCGGFFSLDVGTLASRMEFVAHTMPFMLLGGSLAAGGFAMLLGAKPVRVCLTALLMLLGMAIGHAVTMGMGLPAEWFGSIGGMLLAHCLTSAVSPKECGKFTLNKSVKIDRKKERILRAGNGYFQHCLTPSHALAGAFRRIAACKSLRKER